jgi:DNA-binding MarR family transcriptional regulator
MSRLVPWQQEDAAAADQEGLTHPTMRIGHLATVLSVRFGRLMVQALRPLELTEPQLAILIQLAIGPESGLPLADLVRRAGTTVESLATDLPALAARDLVVSDVQSESMSWTRITGAGRDLARQADRLAEPVEQQALQQLSGSETEVLRALLLRTLAALGTQPDQRTSDE